MSFPKIFSKNAILDWSVAKDYAIGEICRGGGAVLYCSKLASGPSTTAGSKDPAQDDGTYWTKVSIDDEGNVHKIGDEGIDGNKDFYQGIMLCPAPGTTVGPNLTLLRNTFDHKVPTVGESAFAGIYFSDKNNFWSCRLNYETNVNSASSFDQKFRILLRERNDTSTNRSVNFVYTDNSTLSVDPYGFTTKNLGSPNYKWTALYATTGTIQTSDERLKSTITSVPDNVLDAWGELDFVQFQFNDSLQEKGSAARFHSGLIAQSIDQAFSKHNLDASRYGLFCYDEWDAKPERLDENGGRIEDPQPAGNQYSLRYEEALCMEAAYQRRQNSRTESRFLDLEQRIASLEEKIKQEEK